MIAPSILVLFGVVKNLTPVLFGANHKQHQTTPSHTTQHLNHTKTPEKPQKTQ
jgi:hypothetical protein